MTKILLAVAGVIVTALIALVVWRRTDINADQAARARLASYQPASPDTFDPSMVDGLPGPAQRFFRFAIRPGAPLYTVAEVFMDGEFSLGSKLEPNYMPMHAEQVLAAPHGFVWQVSAGDKVWFAGSDGVQGGKSWSRFWLLEIVPVARAGNNNDHLRTAFGRYIAEAVFWSPAVLLPGDNVQWEAIDDSTARVIVRHRGLEQAVDLYVDADGRLGKIVFQRWSDANPDKAFRLQPFGGYLSDYKDFGGFRLPTRVEAGNFFGTDEYFAFFKATVTSVRFPARD